MTDQPQPTPDEAGPSASVRRIGTSLLGLIRTRIDLFAVELQQEKLRASSLLIWLAVAIALLGAGVLVAIGTLAVILWERFGDAGLIALTIATLLAGAVLLWFLRRRIKRGPAPFSATVAEFQKDLACLRPPE